MSSGEEYKRPEDLCATCGSHGGAHYTVRGVSWCDSPTDDDQPTSDRHFTYAPAPEHEALLQLVATERLRAVQAEKRLRLARFLMLLLRARVEQGREITVYEIDHALTLLEKEAQDATPPEI